MRDIHVHSRIVPAASCPDSGQTLKVGGLHVGVLASLKILFLLIPFIDMNLFKALLTVSGYTLLSRITGLIRETLVARTFGAGMYTDAFNVAFRIPNLLRRLSAEGAFSQAFVPIFGEFKNKYGHDPAKAMMDAVATVLAWGLVLLSIIGVVGAPGIVFMVASGLRENGDAFPAAVWMTRVMFPYIALISLASLASGVLNVYRQFSLPAFAPLLLNCSFIVACLWVAPHMTTPVYALALAVLVGGVLQLAIQLPALQKLKMLPKIGLNPFKALKHPGVKRVLAKMVPATFAVSVAQLSLIINTNIASHLPGGSVSWLSYADRLMEFPIALLGLALGTVLLPSLSKAHAQHDAEDYSALLDWGLKLTFLLAAPAVVVLLAFADPITAVLFHYGQFSAQDVHKVGRAVQAYGAGLIGLIAIKVLAPGFYAKQDIRTPALIAVVVLILTQISNVVWVPVLAHAGLALSIGIGACVNALLLFIGLRKKHIYKPLPGWSSFSIKLLGVCLISTGILLWIRDRFDWVALGAVPLQRIGLVGASLAAIVLLYFGLLWLVGFDYAYFKNSSKSLKNTQKAVS